MEVWGSLSTLRTADPHEGKEVLGQLHAIFQLSDGPQKRDGEREREREKGGGCLVGEETSLVERSEVLDGGLPKHDPCDFKECDFTSLIKGCCVTRATHNLSHIL